MTKLTEYDFGSTPSRASRRDPRFSYCLYIPRAFRNRMPAACPLMLVVHGTDRINQTMRDYFSAVAEAASSMVLAPLFPVGVGDASDLDGYKYLSRHGIRYDLLLRDMIEEVAQYYGVAFQSTVIFGFSGGAHFAHRYAYLYPESLNGAVLAAPGMVTLLDDSCDIWAGTRNIAETFGHSIDVASLRRVPFLLLVGADDNAPHLADFGSFGITRAHLKRIGSTRITRLKALRDNLQSHGIPVEYREIPRAGHDFKPVAAEALAFTQERLQQHGT